MIVLVFVASLVVTSLADGPNQIQRRKQKPNSATQIGRKRVQADAPLPKKKMGVFEFLSRGVIINWSKNIKIQNTNFYFRSAFKNEIASKICMNFIRNINEF